MMCREFAPVLAAAGGGAIINLLSAAALVGMPWMGSLSASKAAALRMTEALRAELAGQRTRMLAALPGAVDTAMTAGVQGIAKLDPREVACAMLDALQAGQDRVLIGDEAQRLERRLQADRDGVLADFTRRLHRK
jgi:short-subunit dehydrogenase